MKRFYLVIMAILMMVVAMPVLSAGCYDNGITIEKYSTPDTVTLNDMDVSDTACDVSIVTTEVLNYHDVATKDTRDVQEVVAACCSVAINVESVHYTDEQGQRHSTYMVNKIFSIEQGVQKKLIGDNLKYEHCFLAFIPLC